MVPCEESLGTYPKGPSCKHNSGNPIELIAAIFPTHPPFCHPTPVARPTFWELLNLAKAAVAFEYAEAQSPSPAAAKMGVAYASSGIASDFIFKKGSTQLKRQIEERGGM